MPGSLVCQEKWRIYHLLHSRLPNGPSRSPIVVISSLEADILPGDFLLAQRIELGPSSHPVVCQVLNVVLPFNLEVVCWDPLSVAPPLHIHAVCLKTIFLC